MNEQKPVPIGDDTLTRWKKEFSDIAEDYKSRGGRVVWALLDGFLLYWNQVCRA
jgi:hypothetical protein